MALASLEDIEAGIAFAEDALNCKGDLPSGRPREELHRICRVRLAGGAGMSSSKTQDGPRPSEAAATASPLMRHSEHTPGLKQRQQWAERSPQQRSPPVTATELSQRRQQQQQQPASAPKPCTVEELWAILDSAPTGQPVEIDAGLLYGGESSYDDHSAEAASGSASPGAASEHWKQEPAADDFRLPAYRPPANELAHRSSGLLQNSPAASVGYSRDRQQPQKHGLQQRSGWLPGSAASPPGGKQPKSQKSSPGSQRHHHHWQLSDENAQRQEELAPSTSGRSSRQLPLDDFAAAEGGSRGRLLAAELLHHGRDDRLMQLAQPRTQLWERCSARRVEQQREELAQCTFAPVTGRPPSRHRLASGLPVEDRLLAAAEERQVALEHAAREAASAEVAECTFAPRLLSDPSRHLRDPERRPIHQRLGEEQRRRSAKLAAARLKEDVAGPELTFQPALNQRSLALAAARRERDLFAGPSQPRSTGSAGNMPASPEATVADCTFSPAINPASKALLEGSITVPADFHERQRFFAAKREVTAQRAAAAAASEACTFRPDTGNAVEVLAQSEARSGQLLESEAERCERMAREEAERQAARRAAREAEVYGALEFRPMLNPRSLAIGKSEGIEGLASANRQRAKLAALQQAEEERLRNECPFRPNTSKPRIFGYYSEYSPPQPTAQSAKLSIAVVASSGAGLEGLSTRIAEHQARREARAAAVRAEREAAELAECSFSPAINRRPSSAGKSGGQQHAVVVPGLERFLELKTLAERQRREADERAAKVFHQNPAGGALAEGRRATVPRPFKLEGQAALDARAVQRQAATLQAAAAERLEQCPFKPRTNVQSRQAALDRILAGGQPLVDL